MSHLCLELELLTGAYRASLPDNSGAEWPPHPERVFSALVQAWGDGGRAENERQALEWLEAQPSPLIEASPPDAVSERDAPTVFVPPNDKSDIRMLPEHRKRQARTFKVVVPESPVVRYAWSTCPPESAVEALRSLTSRVASVGHSSSLVRATIKVNPEPPAMAWRPAEGGSVSIRTLHPGRLDDLKRWFSGEVGRVERPRTGRTEPYEPPGATVQAATAQSVFGGPDSWFIFEDPGDGEFTPDVLAFAHISRRVRDALMKLGPQPSPEIITGHGAPGVPGTRPHLAIVPLLSVGWEHASGDLLGFAVVLPRHASNEEREHVVQALGSFVRFDDEGTGRCEVHLTATSVWRLERAASPSRASLKPARYCGSSARWASVTPVLLDRFPEHDDPMEEARLISEACTHIGLPEPVSIEIHKHSALRGASSAYGKGRPRQPTWSFPEGSKLKVRPRRHVVLTFDRPVQGPVLLGAGRYHGFGLCLPLRGEDASRTPVR